MCIQVFPTQSLFGRPKQREFSHFYIYLESIFLYCFYLKVASAGTLFLSWQKKTLTNQWCFLGGLTELPAVLKVFPGSSATLWGSWFLSVQTASSVSTNHRRVTEAEPQIQTSRDAVKNVKKKNEMILKSFWVESRTKTRCLMFKLINFITFLQIYTHSEFDVCNMFRKVPLLSWWFHRWRSGTLDSVCLFL